LINRIVNIIKKTFKHQTTAETDGKIEKKTDNREKKDAVWKDGMME